jgi:hypothetical protein
MTGSLHHVGIGLRWPFAQNTKERGHLTIEREEEQGLHLLARYRNPVDYPSELSS